MSDKIRNIITMSVPVLKRYGIDHAYLVGSFARGEDHSKSDVDILVEIHDPISLLTFSRIKIDLEGILKRKVDLIEISSLKPQLKKLFQEDQIPIC